jgi:uncharacterized membrane protein
MKARYTSLIVAGLIATIGCNTSPPGGSTGGTGATTTTSRTGAAGTTVKQAGSSNATFKLSGPLNIPETSVKQGETKVKDISVDAGKGFMEDITFDVKVDGDKKGVTAKVEPTTWKASTHEKVKLHITASNDAPLGEYVIHVTGTPAKGQATTLDVKIKVAAK